MTVTHVLEGVIALDPDRTALIIGGKPTSYAELELAIGHAAAGLRAAGVAPGWRIPLVDDTSVLAVAALIGATRIGAATALMNPRLTGGELAVLMEAAGTAATGVVGAGYTAVATEAGIDPVLGVEVLSASAGSDPSGTPDPGVSRSPRREAKRA